MSRDPMPDLFMLTSEKDQAFLTIAELISTTIHLSGDKETRLKHFLNETSYIGYTKSKAGEVMGAIIWTYLKDTDFGRLEYLAVAPSYRGQGLGGQFVDHVLWDAFKRKEIQSIFLSVEPMNRKARNLYQKCGFHETIRSINNDWKV